MAFSSAGFMGGLAQLIQGRQQNALADQQSKEKLEERRLQLGMQADQIRKQKIDEERARLTFEEQQKDWTQKGKLRPFEIDTAKTNRDLGKANLSGIFVNNDIAAMNRDTVRRQQQGRDQLFDLSVATPRHQEMKDLTAGLLTLDSTINSQMTIANDVTKPMAEREAAQAAIRNAHNSKFALFNNAKSKVGSVPNLTYADIATAAGIRQPDPSRPVDWNTYNNWESHFPAFTPVPLRKVIAASPEGKQSLVDLDKAILSSFDMTKHITRPEKFFEFKKIKGLDGKDMYQLDPTTPQFNFDKAKMSSEYFSSPAFTNWIKSAAATNRSKESEVVQQLLGIPLTETQYDASGKVLKVGDVDKQGNLIMTPVLAQRIAASYNTRIPTPENLSTVINNVQSQFTDSQRNAITFWNAQMVSGDTSKTAKAAQTTARLSAISDIFKASNDQFMKNQATVDSQLKAIESQIGTLTKAAVSGPATIFGEEIAKASDPIVKKLATDYRALYLKKFIATKRYFAALAPLGDALATQDLETAGIGGYAQQVGNAANLFNAANREPTAVERKAMGFSDNVTAPTNTGGKKPEVKNPIGGNQAGAGLNVPKNTPLGTLRVNGRIDNRQP
jgi:hypothetical protein